MQGGGGLLSACVRGRGRCRLLEVLTAQVRGVRGPVKWASPCRAVWRRVLQLSGSLAVLVSDLQRTRTDRAWVCACACVQRERF